MRNCCALTCQSAFVQAGSVRRRRRDAYALDREVNQRTLVGLAVFKGAQRLRSLSVRSFLRLCYVSSVRRAPRNVCAAGETTERDGQLPGKPGPTLLANAPGRLPREPDQNSDPHIGYRVQLATLLSADAEISNSVPNQAMASSNSVCGAKV